VFTANSNTEALDRAARVRAHLANHGRLRPVALPSDVAQLGRETDEYAVALLSGGMTYHRWSTAAVSYTSGGPSLVVGSEAFVAGYALAAVVGRARQQRRARRMAEAQWRPTQLLRVVVTTHRLWCEVTTNNGPTWRHFNFETITRLDSTGDALTMSFQDSQPLRLSGEWMSWCGAVIEHFRSARLAPTFGTAALAG
jgi:hypothetical protein